MVDYDAAVDLIVRLRDCLWPDHLARFMMNSVGLLDLSTLYARYVSRIREPDAPAVLLALLLYGCATGVFSSCNIECVTYESVPFRSRAFKPLSRVSSRSNGVCSAPSTIRSGRIPPAAVLRSATP